MFAHLSQESHLLSCARVTKLQSGVERDFPLLAPCAISSLRKPKGLGAGRACLGDRAEGALLYLCAGAICSSSGLGRRLGDIE